LDKAPDAFRTISEVAEELDIPQHVLRFWETRFTQIKPMKRSGGRRFYRPDDVDLLRGIRKLLYSDGYTIRGVQRILKEQGVKAVQSQQVTAEPEDASPGHEARPARARGAAPKPPVDVEDAEAIEETIPPQDEAEAGSIVVSPPLPRPFTTPLPSLELRVQTVGMVPRAGLPQAPVMPIAPRPTAPAVHSPNMPDLRFDTLVSRAPQPVTSEQERVEGAQAAPQAVEEPRRTARPAAPDAARLRLVLDDLMGIRRLLDTAMQPGEGGA
jgi:DNA-binding transcriptional MerR regulator